MKKKILFFSEFPSREKPTYYSFVKSRVVALKDSFDITVVKVKMEQLEDKQVVFNEDGYKVIEICIKTGNIPKIKRIIGELKLKKVLYSIVRDNSPHLIEVHFTSYYSWIVRKISKKLIMPYIIIEHASFFEEFVNKFVFGRLSKMALKDASLVIAVSNYLKGKILEYIDVEVKVIPNFVDVLKFDLLKKETCTKLENIVSIITVGGLDKQDKKGYEALIDAARYINNNNFVINIIGDGDNYFKLKELIKNNNLQDKIFLLGSISNDEIVQFYRSADFFVSSSRIETFGVAILEGMACGLPVVATNSGGPEDFITNDVGLIIKNNSIEELINGLKWMMENYKEFDANIIRKYVNDNYSSEGYTKIMNEEYKKLLRK